MSPHRASRILSAAIALLSVAGVAPLFAQEEEEMVTDRPDQSESASIVGWGVWQLETGFSFERDESPGLVSEYTELLGSLVRYGVNDHLELRFGFTAHSRETLETVDGKETFKGLTDPELGLKWRFREGDGVSPAIALLVGTTVPVGDDDFSSDEFDPTVRLAFDHDFSDTLSLGWNLGWSRDSYNDQDLGLYSASFGIAVDDRWGTFYEVFGTIALGGDGDDVHSADTGITLMLNEDLQADVWAGLGINDAAPDTFAGIGLSWRIR